MHSSEMSSLVIYTVLLLLVSVWFRDEIRAHQLLGCPQVSGVEIVVFRNQYPEQVPKILI